MSTEGRAALKEILAGVQSREQAVELVQTMSVYDRVAMPELLRQEPELNARLADIANTIVAVQADEAEPALRDKLGGWRGRPVTSDLVHELQAYCKAQAEAGRQAFCLVARKESFGGCEVTVRTRAEEPGSKGGDDPKPIIGWSGLACAPGTYGAAHDRFRVRDDDSGTFDALQPKLRLLLDRQPYAPVMMTVNPEVVDHFAESAAWLQSQGVQYLIASLNYAGAWTDKALRRLRKEYLALEAWHLENYRRERKIYFSPFDKRIASHVFPGRGTSCRCGRRQISVAPDGTLYPCVQFVGREEYCIGSAAHGIDEARRETIYALNEQDRQPCSGCALAQRCHNKCGWLNLQTTGSITSVPPVLCEHERMAIPIADRLAERLFKERDPLFIQRHYNPAFPILSFLEDLSA